MACQGVLFYMFSQSKLNNFHNDIKYVIRTAQVFGLFPVSNVTAVKYEDLKFQWGSAVSVYSILIISGTMFMNILSLYRILLEGFHLHLLDSFVFNLNALGALILFFKLAMIWPRLVAEWCRNEYTPKNYGHSDKIRRRFFIMLTVVIVAATTEHTLAVLNTYSKIDYDSNSTNETCFELYSKREYPFVFDYIPFSLPLALGVMFVNCCNVFGWNFMDTFIMFISLALSYRFKQIYLQTKMGVKKNYNSSEFWGKIREDYSKRVLLCRKINKTLSYLIMLSFGTNLYTIISQLYKSLTDKLTLIDKCYFFWSFGLLLMRTTCVILYGDMISTQSRKPLTYLLLVKNNSYNVEVKRFILHIYTEEVCLSGNDYFVINKGLIINMATTICTYVLFMLQSQITVNF